MRNEEFIETFASGSSIWIADEIISRVLSTRRNRAGVDVRIRLSKSFGMGDNINASIDANQIPAKTSAGFFQAKTLLNPSFLSTRSLKPCRG